MKLFFASMIALVLVLSGLAVIKSAEVVKSPPASSQLIAAGKALYGQQCAACHGNTGRGDGEAAYLLYPKPRDFVAARYRLVSTWDRVPTDQDLFDTISRGMPGSAMPSWEHLTTEQRWGLVYYIKSFAEKPIEIRSQKMPSADGSGGEGIIEVPNRFLLMRRQEHAPWSYIRTPAPRATARRQEATARKSKETTRGFLPGRVI